MPTIKIKPFTRVEGHLDIEVTVEASGGVQQVVDAKSAGMMFRGFETILQGRGPLDAVIYTQRICGVCPVSHGMAATKALEAAGGVAPADNGRIMRNIVLGANFVQSHILHLYHLAALDYVNTTGVLDMSPWAPHFTLPDMIGRPMADTLVNHYVQALAMRRSAHQLAAIFAGRMPSPANFTPGGSSETVESGAVALARSLLTPLRDFINGVMLPDVNALGAAFPQYAAIGAGPGRLRGRPGGHGEDH
jgi:hydrogenase large subunit